jgi:Secretion system C-terminal sorting domain
MKKTFTLILLLAVGAVNAQISITSADFNSAGDNILVSNESPLTTVDIVTTGANQTWDFSFLVNVSQDTISFLDVANTGTNYALYFANVGFNPNRSNIATAFGNIPAIPGLPVTITDPYSFYYKNSTEYKQQGLGATISGFATPVALNTKDILYNFPIDYLDADSCNSDWSLALPGIGYYGYTQKRVNNVDGWGTLITPYGSFSTLRIATTINGTDSAYLDSLGFGFNFPRPEAKEYKWFGTGQLIPLLQINTTLTLGGEVVSGIVYRDSLRITAINNLSSRNINASLFPNPAANELSLQMQSATSFNAPLQIYDSRGRMVLQKELFVDAGVSKNTIEINSLPDGIYHLVLTTPEGNFNKRFVVLNYSN